VVPLAIDAPALAFLGNKPPSPIEMLFVGRIVPSKGVLDLVQALAHMRRHVRVPFRLRIAGNIEWSDQGYLTRVEREIDENGLGNFVEIVGTVDDSTLSRMYHEAHVFVIPSYHEGFCKPLIEALRAGCVPLGYSSYNLPYVTNGFGRLVPPGAIDLLALGLIDLVQGVSQGILRQEAQLLRLDRGLMSVSAFDAQTKFYVNRFSHAQFSRTIVERIRGLCGRSAREAGFHGHAPGRIDSFLSGAMRQRRAPLSLFQKEIQ
jgi:glycosyltransferase involved in cell wall biosynthesis